MLLARRNKWLAVLLVLLCHELVIAQDGGSAARAGKAAHDRWPAGGPWR